MANIILKRGSSEWNKGGADLLNAHKTPPINQPLRWSGRFGVPVIARTEKRSVSVLWDCNGSVFVPKGDVQSQATVRAIARQVCEQLIQSEYFMRFTRYETVSIKPAFYELQCSKSRRWSARFTCPHVFLKPLPPSTRDRPLVSLQLHIKPDPRPVIRIGQNSAWAAWWAR